MKWTLLKWYLKWQIARTLAGDRELDALYQHEKAINAKALKQLSARLENLEQERVQQALGSLPL